LRDRGRGGERGLDGKRTKQPKPSKIGKPKKDEMLAKVPIRRTQDAGFQEKDCWAHQADAEKSQNSDRGKKIADED